MLSQIGRRLFHTNPHHLLRHAVEKDDLTLFMRILESKQDQSIDLAREYKKLEETRFPFFPEVYEAPSWMVDAVTKGGKIADYLHKQFRD